MFKKTMLVCSLALLCAFVTHAATVGGVVKENSAAGAAIAGALVTLTSTGGGAAVVDTMTTDATGAYSFATVAVGTYRLTVVKTGYRVAAATTVDVVSNTATYTENLYLVATGTTGSYTVSGIVYDSVAGSAITALSGAKVILSSRAIAGGTATHDTVTTGQTGSYTFDSVAVGTYTLAVSASGYASQTANVTVAAADIAQDFKLIHTVTSSVAGAVTDSTSGTALVGVKVYLLTRGTGAATIIDSTATITAGAYSFAAVPSATAGVNYTVRASMTGYVTSNTNITVTGTTASTVNIKLVPIVEASISGTVTDSSASGVAPLSGVQVTLRSGTTVVDSVVTGVAGTYSFANVPTGVTYTVRAVDAGYVTSNTNLDMTGAGAQTVNIRLVKTPSGNLYVKVMARTDSAAISGASVTAATGATTLTGMTIGTGLASFLGVATGNYTLTISAANYTAISTTTALTANSNDTVKIYLVAAANGTKTLTGVIKDSASSTPLQHVAVVLVIQGAGIGGAALTLVDSTTASGTYTFAGIPIASVTGRLTATLSGYRTFTNTAVPIGAANTADNTIYNFVMVMLPAGVAPSVSHAVKGTPDFGMASKGMLRLTNIGDAGVVRVFGLNGALLYRSSFSARTTSLSLPANMVRSGNAYIVSLSQTNAELRKQVIMP